MQARDEVIDGSAHSVHREEIAKRGYADRDNNRDDGQGHQQLDEGDAFFVHLAHVALYSRVSDCKARPPDKRSIWAHRRLTCLRVSSSWHASWCALQGLAVGTMGRDAWSPRVTDDQRFGALRTA